MNRFLKSIAKRVKRSKEENVNQLTNAAVEDTSKDAVLAGADSTALVGSQEIEPAQTEEVAIKLFPEPDETKQRILPKQAVICVGEYPGKILVSGQLPKLKDQVQSIFVDKSSEEVIGWSKGLLDASSVAGLDANLPTQFWYQVAPYLSENKDWLERVKSRLEGNKFGVLVVSSLWDGIGSAVPIALTSRLKEWNINTVIFAISPSILQAAAAQYNAFSSIGKCLAEESAPIILAGRDQLNEYVGVDRNGLMLKGATTLDYIVEMMLTRATFVEEFSEMARLLSVKVFTVFAATGASLKVYGSLENLLNSTTFRPLQAIDLSSASLLYVLVRLPAFLRNRLTKDMIELAVTKWFKDKAVLKSIYVAEPLYVSDVTDRVDLLFFVGGFNLGPVLSTMEIEPFKTQAVKKGLVKEAEWKAIVKTLGVS